MGKSNISVFVPHVGCPHMCSFCNQRTITGTEEIPREQDVRRICSQALSEVKDLNESEIAFFGGSFTAIPKDYMLELLNAAQDFIGEGKFKGIRISTRPDCIDEEILSLLKKYHVTAIELGAQSMCDKVLEANERGHTAADVETASRLIREYGFELGLQMMVGLYKSEFKDELDTMNAIIALKPYTLRIYPVVILENTKLGDLFKSGEYVPMKFDSVVSLCSIILEKAQRVGIKVIKCGLHASEFVEEQMLGGFYHPAFRELCEAEIYRDIFREELENNGSEDGNNVIAVEPKCISKAVGQKRANIEYFKSRGVNLKIVGDESLGKYECKIVK